MLGSEHLKAIERYDRYRSFGNSPLSSFLDLFTSSCDDTTFESQEDLRMILNIFKEQTEGKFQQAQRRYQKLSSSETQQRWERAQAIEITQKSEKRRQKAAEKIRAFEEKERAAGVIGTHRYLIVDTTVGENPRVFDTVNGREIKLDSKVTSRQWERLEKGAVSDVYGKEKKFYFDGQYLRIAVMPYKKNDSNPKVSYIVENHEGKLFTHVEDEKKFQLTSVTREEAENLAQADPALMAQALVTREWNRDSVAEWFDQSIDSLVGYEEQIPDHVKQDMQKTENRRVEPPNRTVSTLPANVGSNLKIVENMLKRMYVAEDAFSSESKVSDDELKTILTSDQYGIVQRIRGRQFQREVIRTENNLFLSRSAGVLAVALDKDYRGYADWLLLLHPIGSPGRVVEEHISRSIKMALEQGKQPALLGPYTRNDPPWELESTRRDYTVDRVITIGANLQFTDTHVYVAGPNEIHLFTKQPAFFIGRGGKTIKEFSNILSQAAGRKINVSVFDVSQEDTGR